MSKVWKPFPRQQEALSWTGIKELLYGGARGGGKTEAGIPWVARPALERRSPKFRGLVLRENAEDLADWLDRADEALRGSGAKVAGRMVKWPTGEKILCGHLKDARSIRKWLGREFQRVLIEELTSIPTEELYVKILGSCRSSIPGLDARLMATTNPGGPGHAWVKRRFIDSPWGKPFMGYSEDGIPTGWRLFVQSKVDDNPALCKNDPDYVRYLDSLPADIRSAWRDGSWDMMQGQYFPEFRRESHVVRPFSIPSHWRRYRVLDWGYDPDPWFCLWFAVDERGNEVCYREAYGNRMLPFDVAKRILELSRAELDQGAPFGQTICGVDAWAEDDGPSSAEKMGKAGLHLTKANTDRLNGWMRCHEYFALNPATGRPWLTFFDTCSEIIRCIPALIHDERNPMDVMGNSSIDHGPDALRYHLMSRPSRGILADKIPGWKSLKAMRYRKEQEEQDAGR